MARPPAPPRSAKRSPREQRARGRLARLTAISRLEIVSDYLADEGLEGLRAAVINVMDLLAQEPPEGAP